MTFLNILVYVLILAGLFDIFLPVYIRSRMSQTGWFAKYQGHLDILSVSGYLLLVAGFMFGWMWLQG